MVPNFLRLPLMRSPMLPIDRQLLVPLLCPFFFLGFLGMYLETHLSPVTSWHLQPHDQRLVMCTNQYSHESWPLMARVATAAACCTASPSSAWAFVGMCSGNIVRQEPEHDTPFPLHSSIQANQMAHLPAALKGSFRH